MRNTEHLIVLVSCVAMKRLEPVPAKDLYTSPWFTKARAYAEKQRCPWYILSAEHGLVQPAQILAPYERTLNTMSVADRRHWAQRVLGQLAKLEPQPTRVVFLAGVRYREFLLGSLKDRGIQVEVPMQGKSIGRQLQWLSRA
jgi:hypothetical protein